MPSRGTETEFELTTIERLERLGYTHLRGGSIERELDEVVLTDRLRASLARLYPDLPAATLDELTRRFARPEGADTLRRNFAFHLEATRGIDITVEFDDGRTEDRHIYPIDWDAPDRNEFLVVNQLPVRGSVDRRPDLVIYVNGLPLGVFELKNPYDEHPTADHAINQLRHYAVGIPQLFEHNAVTVASDGVRTLHGVWTADPEWYSPWQSVDGRHVEPDATGSMKTLVEGLFQKDQLLAYVRDFVLFEQAHEVIVKKGARYHQFFAVREAAERTVAAVRRGDDRRVGVIWHTTGAGKSLSMLFLVGLLRRLPELENPTFVLQVDRNDLDDQLHDQFVASRSLVGPVKQAGSTNELRELLRTQGGGVIFTTIEKFRLKSADEAGAAEVAHPVLSERSNVIVIADEAHRSQYGFAGGYARNLAEALPNACRIGFTGTPISFAGADTIAVFGDYIHTYDIRQAQQDRVTVPIFYSPRQIRLHLSDADVDAALAEITGTADLDDVERRKGRWAALAAAAGARDRLDELARDLVDHYRDRRATLEGKAMVVCMSRLNCVRLHQAMTALPDCPEVAVVMTGSPATDPVEWSEQGYLTTKPQRDAIKERMKDVDDPLRIVLVCDMWLTGTDIPCLHTLYIDKPMKGHNMIQAISRVNRVFRDKPHGLIVDYIGIGDELREATATYTREGAGEPAADVETEGVPVFLEALASVRALMPDEDWDCSDWRRLPRPEQEDLHMRVVAHLAAEDELRDRFLEAEDRMSKAFTLVKHLDECRYRADEVVFYQRIRQQVRKGLISAHPGRDIESAVRDLVDESIGSEGVVDVFRLAGIERADLSILDEDFLQTFRDRPQPNLQLKLLEKLMREEVRRRRPKNVAKAKSFSELLENTLRRYHNRLIDAAAVIEVMIRIRKEMEDDDERAAELGLDEDELAFYDAVVDNIGRVYDDAFLRELVHQVVQSVRANLKVDWTEAHRSDVHAAVRAAVKRVLRRNRVSAEHFDALVGAIMIQAEALYRDWPAVA